MLLFGSRDGDTIIQPNWLVVTIDETGDTTRRDPRHPVFGLAGCAVLAKDYDASLATPWMRMKDRVFDGRQSALHAADLRQPSEEQISALNSFFRDAPIARFGAFITDRSALHVPVAPYAVVGAMLIRQLAQVLRIWQCNGITLVVESSPKHDDQFFELFSTLEFKAGMPGSEAALPLTMFRSDKNPGIPSLEVADFIAHTGGIGTRASLGGSAPSSRPEMEIVFGPPEPVAQYIRIDEFTRGAA
ncbi:MAG TPA: hypothetical protein VE967_10235 [Gemmatimonadaceae bacterium]|nr:hypothetical protein [Gemmatimonadaceae bacterium]